MTTPAIILAFTSCLMAEPDHCEAHELRFSAESLTVWQCTVSGHVPLVAWAMAHPGWRVRDYRCLSSDEV